MIVRSNSQSKAGTNTSKKAKWNVTYKIQLVLPTSIEITGCKFWAVNVSIFKKKTISKPVDSRI